MEQSGEQSKDQPDNRWRAYEAALRFVPAEGAYVWQRFYVFLAINTFVLGAGVLRDIRVPRALLGILGIIISFLWLSLVKRGFTYFNYYMQFAREQEKQIDFVDLLRRGQKLGNGEEIKVDGNCLRMPWSARQLTAHKAAYLTIYLFMAGYGALFLWGMCSALCATACGARG